MFILETIQLIGDIFRNYHKMGSDVPSFSLQFEQVSQ